MGPPVEWGSTGSIVYVPVVMEIAEDEIGNLMPVLLLFVQDNFVNDECKVLIKSIKE